MRIYAGLCVCVGVDRNACAVCFGWCLCERVRVLVKLFVLKSLIHKEIAS